MAGCAAASAGCGVALAACAADSAQAECGAGWAAAASAAPARCAAVLRACRAAAFATRGRVPHHDARLPNTRPPAPHRSMPARTIRRGLHGPQTACTGRASRPSRLRRAPALRACRASRSRRDPASRSCRGRAGLLSQDQARRTDQARRLRPLRAARGPAVTARAAYGATTAAAALPPCRPAWVRGDRAALVGFCQRRGESRWCPGTGQACLARTSAA